MLWTLDFEGVEVTSRELLRVEGLSVDFDVQGGCVQAVRNLSLRIRKQVTLAVIGESGCGKSVMAMSLLRLLPSPPARIRAGRVIFDGQNLLECSNHQLNRIRGATLAMIFQDPMTSLNPTMRIGHSIAETLRVHLGYGRSQALAGAKNWLEQVGIPAERATSWPFECSGGMLQRVMIAQALAGQPRLLIADEPTTALDVTVQAGILELIKEMQRKQSMSLLFITHDLSVVAGIADEVAVMYAGQVIEQGRVEDILYRMAHPYTLGLYLAAPGSIRQPPKRLSAIAGSPPDLLNPPTGCSYCERCPYAMKICAQKPPPVFAVSSDHWARCWLHAEAAPAVDAPLPFVQSRKGKA